MIDLLEIHNEDQKLNKKLGTTPKAEGGIG